MFVTNKQYRQLEKLWKLHTEKKDRKFLRELKYLDRPLQIALFMRMETGDTWTTQT